MNDPHPIDYGTPEPRRPIRWGRIILIVIAVIACLFVLDLVVGSFFPFNPTF
jgi:hypothetical protein